MIILIYLYLGMTSLHYAAEDGYTDIVKILLDHGANASTKDNYGMKDNKTPGWTWKCQYKNIYGYLLI